MLSHISQTPKACSSFHPKAPQINPLDRADCPKMLKKKKQKTTKRTHQPQKPNALIKRRTGMSHEPASTCNCSILSLKHTHN